MMASMMRWLRGRGLRAMTSSAIGSTPMASAGPVSVTRLIHRICVASSGSTTAPPEPVAVAFRPMTPAPTTPANTVSTSARFDDSR
jgi:hypothetical protein